eukprot:1535650-Prymnesium_polylepis.1
MRADPAGAMSRMLVDRQSKLKIKDEVAVRGGGHAAPPRARRATTKRAACTKIKPTDENSFPKRPHPLTVSTHD